MLNRSNDDIKSAVDAWCENPQAAEEMYGHISKWNTSKVTSMQRLFQHQQSEFNEDIGGWDVSSVTDMYGMFQGASSFDQNIGR